MKRYTSKEKYEILSLLNTTDISYIIKTYNISLRTLYRWKANFDGTKQSLENKSSIPHTKHPNSHTEFEERIIFETIDKYFDISLSQLYDILCSEYDYKRNKASLYRFLRKRGFSFKQKEQKSTTRTIYHIKKPQ